MTSPKPSSSSSDDGTDSSRVSYFSAIQGVLTYPSGITRMGRGDILTNIDNCFIIFQSQVDLTFDKFQKLGVSGKQEILAKGLYNLLKKFEKDKWMYRCVRNFYVFKELYAQFLHLNLSMRLFCNTLLGDGKMKKEPSYLKTTVYGLDFLVVDFDNIIDMLITILEKKDIQKDDQLNEVFHFALKVNTVLGSFRSQYS